MKKIIIILFLVSTLFAKNYYITYGNITLGKITNINTIKEGYLVAKPTNRFLRYILNFDHYIVYERGKKPIIKGDNEYKRDKFFILKLVNELQYKRKDKISIKESGQTINVTCKSNNCTYVRKVDKETKEFTGYINFTKKNELSIICDDESNICIKRKK